MMGIYIVVVPFILLVVMLLINTYYLKVVHANSQENHIIKGLNGKYDAIALGSAYCRYGIDFSETNVNGYNFGYASQFFYYTDKMLRYIAPKCLNKGGTVYLIIADLVFASIGKKELNYKGMMRFLPYSILKDDHTFIEYFQANFPVFFSLSILKESFRFFLKSILVGKNENEYDTLNVNPLTEIEIKEAANMRCNDWCKQFGLSDTFSVDLPIEIEETFKYTRLLLSSMINFCMENDYKPVIVVLPVSKIMKSKLGDDFLNKVLFENITSANKENAQVINLLDNKKFSSKDLYYRNADFLNARGRKECTKELIK